MFLFLHVCNGKHLHVCFYLKPNLKQTESRWYPTFGHPNSHLQCTYVHNETYSRSMIHNNYVFANPAETTNAALK